jgi:FAD:protein FMN transferase
MSSLFYFKFKAMGSPCELQIASLSKAKARQIYLLVKARAEELEARYSRFRSGSLISKINAQAGSPNKVTIDKETVALLHYAQQCYEESDGLFDITSGILRKVWNFQHKTKLSQQGLSTQSIQQQINQLLPLVSWQDVIWDSQSIFLPKEGMELDLGGIVKEYAADCIKELCLSEGVQSGYINMGGDICIIGALADGSGWPIAIQHPENKKSTLGTFKLKQGGLASSGDYERFITINKKRYSHVINPQTGWPVSGLQSVSITAEHCIIAGSLATIAMLKGKQGVSWLKQTGANYICCTDDGKVYHNL